MPQHPDDRDRLDLPLGGEGPDAPAGDPWDRGPREWGEEGAGGEEPVAPAAARGDGHEPAPTGGRRWAVVLLALLALLVLVVLAGVAGYLLPRPGPPVLRLDSALVDFGAVRVGELAPAHELTLESTGERPVRIGELALAGPAADAFEIAADGCSGTSLAPGRSCTVVLRFAPRRSAALRATLEIPAEASNGPLSVPVTGDGVASEPVVDRRRVDFPPVPVGAPSRPELLTLGNRGGAPLEVEGVRIEGAAAGDFVVDGDRCTGESLDPGEECTLRVVFAPGAEGERSARLRLRVGGGGAGAEHLDVALSGVAIGARAAGPGPTAPETGAAPSPRPAPPAVPPPPPPPPPPPKLSAEPGAVDFGEVPVGGEAAGAAVVVRNAGGSPARIAPLALAGPDAASFSLRDDGCGGGELEAGERCTVRVLFGPRQEGVQQARFAVGSPDLPEGAAAVEVTLRGAGAVGRLALAARELDFGEVQSGGSAERRLTLANSGRAPLEVRAIGVRGEGARELAVTADDCPETVPLAPGDRCELTVRFAPAAEGAREATLSIAHGGPGSPAAVRLRGVGLPAPAPRAEVTPRQARFGPVAVSGRSDIETVTVANRGTARMALGEPRIEGADGGDFHVVPGSCAGASFLVPGSDCTVGVRFSPSAPGERRARLVIPHDAEGGRAVVELAGTGGS